MTPYSIETYSISPEFTGKSDVEIDIRAKRYIGVVGEVKGYYENLSNSYLGGLDLMLTGTTTGLSRNYIYCLFDEKWKDELIVLKKDELVAVKGIISGVTDRHVSIKNCELKY